MSKAKKILIGIFSVVFAIALTVAIVPTARMVSAEEDGFYFDFSDLKGNYARITDTLDLGDIVLQASSLYNMGVDGNAKQSSDGKLSFKQRLKFEGKTSGMYRTISFFLEKKAKITVYAYSGSSSDPYRRLALYKNGSTEQEFYKESPDLQTEGDVQPFTWETTEAGSYYIANIASGSVSVYYLKVEYTGEADPVQRNDWADVAAPAITNVKLSDDGTTIDVAFSGVIGNNGADYAVVEMLDATQAVVFTRRFLSYGNGGSVSFTPTKSGRYTFVVKLVRKGQSDKVSPSSEFDFTYILATPTLRAMTVKDANNGDALTLMATVGYVPEADYYTLTWAGDKNGEVTLYPAEYGDEITYLIEGLTQGGQYTITVKATRQSTDETTKPKTITAIVRDDVERDWQFAYFGTSTNGGRNYSTGNIYDGLKMYSCTVKAGDEIGDKGGKFTYGYFDGISYYYTKINPDEEDFVLRSTITVDYINPKADGQEGFALLVRDSIGLDGSTDPFYTNSAAAICTKIQQLVGSANETKKDGIGARFVTGVKDTFNINAEGSNPLQKMYFYDRTVTVRKNDQYTFEVEKKNNAYYTRYYNTAGKLVSEKVLFHTEEVDDGNPDNDGDYDQLRQIEKDAVYVGFAVARGCNATFDDVYIKVTPRSTEYIEIVPEPITADSSIASPTTSSIAQYNFKFYANSDGIVNVYLNDNGSKDETKLVVKDQAVVADEYFETIIVLTESENKFETYFEPTPDWTTPLGEKLDFYDEQVRERYVIYKSYGLATESIVVAPTDLTESPTGLVGSASGTGSFDAPLDLQTAVNYVLPGQTIYMLDGTYSITDGNLSIEKGNDGTADAIKTLRAFPENRDRPVINFKQKGTGIKMWGNYWHLYGFDITGTKDANKGIQVGGHYCVIEMINAYNNGDTGIQVSGKSTDKAKFWPTYNLILNCTSYSNADKSQEDADGFGAKLYCGEGNVFRGCISYCNADDGWDLYAKTETGPIGQVTIENCITFGNGFNVDGSPTNGNGNGFKVGGENLSGHHVVRNCISFGNKMKGIDSNSCPDVEVYNSISVYNSKYNYAFYTATGVNPVTHFKASGNVSLLGLSSDNLSGAQEEGAEYLLKSENNYFFYNDNAFQIGGNNQPKGSYNASGAKMDATMLTGWDTSWDLATATDLLEDGDHNSAYKYFGFALNGEGSKGVIEYGNFRKVVGLITREADGGIVLKDGFMTLNSKAPANAGASFAAVHGSTTGAIQFADVTFAANFNTVINSIGGVEIKPTYTRPTDPDQPTDGTSQSAVKPANGGSGNWWIFVVIGGAVAIAAAVVVIVLMKKKKA